MIKPFARCFLLDYSMREDLVCFNISIYRFFLEDFLKFLRELNVTGKDAEASLVRSNITCNKNGIPFDTQKMTITSGIRLGSQAATTRGFGLNEFKKIGELITKVIKGLEKNSEDNSKIEIEVRKEVITLCSKFPIYNHLIKN